MPFQFPSSDVIILGSHQEPSAVRTMKIGDLELLDFTQNGFHQENNTRSWARVLWIVFLLFIILNFWNGYHRIGNQIYEMSLTLKLCFPSELVVSSYLISLLSPTVFSSTPVCRRLFPNNIWTWMSPSGCFCRLPSDFWSFLLVNVHSLQVIVIPWHQDLP